MIKKKTQKKCKKTEDARDAKKEIRQSPERIAKILSTFVLSIGRRGGWSVKKNRRM